MNHIPPHSLWIGSAGDLQDWRKLYDTGIRAIVQLAYEEIPVPAPRDFILFRFPLIDGGDNDPDLLRLAITTLTHLLEQKFATLVCCQAGTSRSPAIAAAALACITREPFAASLHQLATFHSWSIHPDLFAQIQGL